MQAGELDRRIAIERPTITQQDYGEPLKQYTAVAEVWAKVVPGAAQETFNGDQVLAVAAAEFWIRYRADIDCTCRIHYANRYYDIRAVIEIGRRHGLKLTGVATNP